MKTTKKGLDITKNDVNKSLRFNFTLFFPHQEKFIKISHFSLKKFFSILKSIFNPNDLDISIFEKKNKNIQPIILEE